MKSYLFAEESPRTIACLRIGVGIVFFFDAIIRWPYVVELYTSDGMPMPLFPGTRFEPPGVDAIFGVLLYSLLLYGLICIVIGWKTRWNLCVVFVLSCWFGLLDSAGTFKKYSVLELHLLILLCFSNCHLFWSLDALLKKSRRRLTFLTPAWPRRLIQILISSLYLQSVITKIQSPDFASGDVLFFNMLDDRWGGTWLGMWVATKPILLVAASWGTLFFEMAAGLLLWVRAARIPMLIIAYLFHIGIWMTMHVGIFSPVMLVLVLAFVDEDDLYKIKKIFGKILPAKVENAICRLRNKWDAKIDSWKNGGFFRRRGQIEEQPNLSKKLVKEWTYFLLSACVFVVVGYQYQQHFDRYRVFGEETELEWTYLPDDFIDQISPVPKIAMADFVFRVETGDRRGNRHVFGEKEKYRFNSVMHTLVRFNRNHPALILEYLIRLKTDDGEEIDINHPILEIKPSSNFQFLSFDLAEITQKETLPDKYIFVLKVDGEEVFRKNFEVVPDDLP